ncbi:predicted protein [Bathycoccus prasinos]|uniref:Acyl carrier protein n=1 Tax=Bathycoccus prasinos TaxID=41875 RepID=K8F214_9CHLO|nr:predicted protein [Bathycoccus prasinos]CCO66140.1 predicted protein [Bathycoccus prasinos]|eukprot:XP_007512052.1 predicted protein [Bathycoccus prasinos]
MRRRIRAHKYFSRARLPKESPPRLAPGSPSTPLRYVFLPPSLVLDRVHKRLQSDSILTFINAFSLLSSSFYKQSGDTLDKVRGIISEQLGTDLDAVAADSKFVDLGADSLDTVEIMMALEEQFEITLDEEGAEKIGTVQEAADMIQTQIDA